ncbi:MAG TPA: GldG family protein [Thermoanaerobaculia bacterium]|nr:GldG family protein [Thermoanaerobaculia bacterium]
MPEVPEVPEVTRVNRRQLVRTGTLSAAVLLLTALLLIVNYFGWKYYKRFDWTSNQLYSLSEKTLNVLKDLKKDVEFIVFLSPDQQRELYKPTTELLARYGAASRRVHVRVVDPEKKPVEAQQLVQRYGVTTTGVVVASGNDKRVIDSNDLAELDFRSMQTAGAPQMTGFKGEQLFTSAILQLSEGRKPRILFTTGHGEHSLDDQSERGFSGAQQILGRDNFQMEEWASLGKPAVPPGTDLVVIAGPRGSFVQPELDALSAYLNNGGRMLVLLDPTPGPAAGSGLVGTGLEGWLGRYGVKVGQDIVVDPSNPLPFFGPETIFSKDYGDHPITRALAEGSLPVLMSVVRSMAPGSAPGVKDTELLRTSADGWGETDLANLDKVSRDPRDVAGPVPLGVVAESGSTAPGKRPMRLAVFGDSDFAANQLLQANAPNAVLISNALNWLVEREALLGIPPKKTEQVKLTLTRDEIRMIYLLALALPVLSVVLGAAVYFRRRR